MTYRLRSSLLFIAALFGLLSCAGPQTSGQKTDAQKAASNNGQGSAVDVTVGGEHACALHASGRVSCWGRNHLGQLGDASTSDRFWAAPVDGLEDATKVVAGAAHTCALRETGQVLCWGATLFGLSGDGGDWRIERRVPAATTPTPVSGANGYLRQMWWQEVSNTPGRPPHRLEGIIDISAGDSQTCAVHQSGAIVCWGNYQADARVPIHHPVNLSAVPNPLPVYTDIRDATRVFVTQAHDAPPQYCALRKSGQVTCWTRSSIPSPIGFHSRPFAPISALYPLKGPKLRALALKNQCSLGGDDLMRCTEAKPPEYVDDATLAALANQACVALRDGRVVCAAQLFDDFFTTQRGDASARKSEPEPVLIEELWSATKVAVGGTHKLLASFDSPYKHDLKYGAELSPIRAPFACAVLKNGALKCWGNNAYGQIGQIPEATPAAPAMRANQVLFEKPAGVPYLATNAYPTSLAAPPNPSQAEYAKQAKSDPSSINFENCPTTLDSGPRDAPNQLELRSRGDTRRFFLDDVALIAQANTMMIILPKIRFRSGRDHFDSLALQFRVQLDGEPKAGDRLPVLVAPEVQFLRLGCFPMPSTYRGTLQIKRVRMPKTGDNIGFMAGTLELFAGSKEFGAITLEFETSSFGTRTAIPDEEVSIPSSANYIITRDGTQNHAEMGKASYDGTQRLLNIWLSKRVENAAATGASAPQLRPIFGMEFRDIDLKPGIYQFAPNPFLVNGERQYRVLELKKDASGHLRGAYYILTRPFTTYKKSAHDDASSLRVPHDPILIQREPPKGSQFSIELSTLALDPSDKVAEFSLKHLVRTPRLKNHIAYQNSFGVAENPGNAKPMRLRESQRHVGSLLFGKFVKAHGEPQDTEGLSAGTSKFPAPLYHHQVEPTRRDGKTLLSIRQDVFYYTPHYFTRTDSIIDHDFYGHKRILVDPETLRPQQTRMRLPAGYSERLSTLYAQRFDVRVDWHPEQVDIQVENTTRGKDRFTLHLPAGIPVYDIGQTLHLLPNLPLKPGYQTFWKALSIEPIRSLPFPTLGRMNGENLPEFRVWPRLLDVRFKAEGVEQLEKNGASIATLRTTIRILDGRSSFEATVWLAQHAPHRIVAYQSTHFPMWVIDADEMAPALTERIAHYAALRAPSRSNISAMRDFLDAYRTCSPATIQYNPNTNYPAKKAYLSYTYKILGAHKNACRMQIHATLFKKDILELSATCSLPSGHPFEALEERLITQGLVGIDAQISCEGSLVDYLKKGGQL